MSLPILTTKLYIPPRRPKAIDRQPLIDRLNSGLDRKLTLIAAPAGFGKSTLAALWATSGRRPAAWLSLDKRDNDLTRFLTYLVVALQMIDPEIGGSSLNLMQADQPLPTEFFLSSLITEITATARPFLLVLDDYHLIEAAPVHDTLLFLLDHLPPQVHLVIVSRTDPPFLLARLRARDELTELRAADLRFTLDESATFLNQAMGLNLSAAEITALESRAEGWVAGLQMIALSLQGRSDRAEFIRSFAGNHRFILDYLVEEVLNRQPANVRQFLLYTAILDRLSGPLCDAITEVGTEVSLKGSSASNGAEMLVQLERENVFLVPLDDERRWYRYHHLFGDVLQSYLTKEAPDRLSTLHLRASIWFEQNSFFHDAVQHAFAAGDGERAAGLIEQIWPMMRRTMQESTVLAWIKRLPDPLIQRRPVLSVVAAWALLDSGAFAEAEERLLDAEKMTTLATENIGKHHPFTVIDQAQYQSLPATIANARAYRAQALGNIDDTIKYTQQALDLLQEENHFERGTTAALLGLAHWANGDLDLADHSFAKGMLSLEKGGNLHIVVGGTLVLAKIKIAKGDLLETQQMYERVLQTVMEEGEVSRHRVSLLYLGLSEIMLEFGDLEKARTDLQKGKSVGEHTALSGFNYAWFIVEARIKEAEGDFDEALALLREAEKFYFRSPIPDAQPISAYRARIWIVQGALDKATEWARSENLSASDQLSYVQEYNHITLARLLLAQAIQTGSAPALQEVSGLLKRLLTEAEKGGRLGSVIEIHILQALAFQAERSVEEAVATLRQAIRLAEPKGHVHLFVRERKRLATLLKRVQQYDREHGSGQSPFIQKLLNIIETRNGVSKSENDRRSLNAGRVAKNDQAITLSRREADVLHYFSTELSGPEIAEELSIALSTVRTHTKSIYNKLDVNNRRAAVNRAKALGLI